MKRKKGYAACGIVALMAVLLQLLGVGSGPVTQAAGAELTQNGETVYKTNCLSCHGTSEKPGMAPNLFGKDFRASYANAEEAYAFVSKSMPDNDPGSLTDAEYKAVVTYLMKLNGLDSGGEGNGGDGDSPVPTDISGHWAEKTIVALFKDHVLDGYASEGKLLYKPSQAITRMELVRYLVKARQLKLSAASGLKFNDVKRLSEQDRQYIATAAAKGFVAGDPDGRFRAGDPVTRAEASSMLAKLLKLEKKPTSRFTDVSKFHWANGSIGAVQAKGIMLGDKSGKFRPNDPITRAEAALVVDRAR